MPKTKQFEYMDINDLMFGSKKISYMDMYELSQHFYEKIISVFEYIEEGKRVSIEVPEEDCLYILERVTSHKFILTNNNRVKQELSGIETVNWLFAKAPWFGMIGFSGG